MDDVAVLARIVLRDPVTLAGGIVASVTIGAVWWWLVKDRLWSRGRLGCAVLSATSLGFALSIVLGREGLSIGRSWYCLSNPGVAPSTAEEALNLVLCAPAAFFAVLATRRPFSTAAAFLVGVVAVECLQKWIDAGTCEVGDMTRNAVGVCVGVAAAAVVLACSARRPQAEQQDCVGVGTPD